MSSVTPKLVVIAVDGLDWPLLQQLVDEGNMPYCQKLIENGASGRINIPPPHSSAAIWSTVATGVLADQHGVCHDLEIRDDGVTVQSVSHQGLKAVPFWHSAITAGKSVRVAGWPATMGINIPEANANNSCIVSNGVEKAQPAGANCWPLAPEAISPKHQRETILELLVHPNDLDINMLLPFSNKASNNADLIQVTAGLLAEIASIHNWGTLWAEQSDWDLLTLRFSFLPTWLTTIQKHHMQIKEALHPWYRYLDLMIGRYMALAGQQANLMIISEHGLAPSQSTPLDTLLGLKTAGSLIVCGPNIASDTLLVHSSGLDICSSILGLLDLPIPQGVKGKDLFSAVNSTSDTLATLANAATSAPSNNSLALKDIIKQPTIDSAALSWLAQQGCAEINLAPLLSLVEKVKAEIMAGWAAAKYVSGNREQAINALQGALAIQPQNLALRLSLANKLLETGQVENCKGVVEGLPAAAQEGDWPDLISCLLAFAEQDWPIAEQHLLNLLQSKSGLINVQGWLGHIKLAQQKWLEAAQYYQLAISGSGELAGYYEGLGKAHLQLKNFEPALAAFSNAIALHPLNARLLVHRAKAYEKINHTKLAQQDLWQAISINPTFMPAHGQLAALLAN